MQIRKTDSLCGESKGKNSTDFDGLVFTTITIIICKCGLSIPIIYGATVDLKWSNEPALQCQAKGIHFFIFT